MAERRPNTFNRASLPDNRLLESGELALLLSGWVETITGRCVAKMRVPVGHDVAQAVCERLWREAGSSLYWRIDSH